MTVMSWTPYRWEPILTPGQPLRVTFLTQGPLAGLRARLGEHVQDFVLSEGGAELIVDPAVVEGVEDRAAARIEVDTGVDWETLAQGHVTKVRRRSGGIG